METKTVVKVLVSGVLLLAVGVAIFPIFDYVIHIELEKVCYHHDRFLPFLVASKILVILTACLRCLSFV